MGDVATNKSSTPPLSPLTKGGRDDWGDTAVSQAAGTMKVQYYYSIL